MPLTRNHRPTTGAREWLEAVLSGTEAVAFRLDGPARLPAHLHQSGRDRARALARDALKHIDEWLAQPVATVVNPTDAHAATLRRLLQPLGTAGNLTTDAHLAALAIEHGAEVCSSDNDFARFEGLRWFNPLAR